VKTSVRLISVLLVALVVVVAPAAALATSNGFVVATEEPADDATSDEPQFEEGQEPAEVAPADSADEDEQPWTARFIAPGLLTIGVLALVGSIAYYGVRVRSRYEVVD